MPLPAVIARAAAIPGQVKRWVSEKAAGVARAVSGTRKVRRAGAILNLPKDAHIKSNWLLDHAWNLQALQDMAGRLYEKGSLLWPAFSHTISVSVQGGPEADLRRVWYLCLAAAFGRYRNRALGWWGATELDAVWDITGKAATVTIGYQNSGWSDASTRIQAAKGAAAGAFNSGLSLIQRGPDQVTVGGSWPQFTYMAGQNVGNAGFLGILQGGRAGAIGGGQLLGAISAGSYPMYNRLLKEEVSVIGKGTLIQFVGAGGRTEWFYRQPCDRGTNFNLVPIGGWQGRSANVLGEMPRIAGNIVQLPWRRVAITGTAQRATSTLDAAFEIPILPDDGRVITTGERFDPRVQNPRPPLDGISRASLNSLVAQALSAPCYLPESPPCSPTFQGTSGIQLYAPGLGLEDAFLGGGNAAVAVFSQLIDKVSPTLATSPLAAAANAIFLPAYQGPDGYTIPTDSNAIPNLRGEANAN